MLTYIRWKLLFGHIKASNVYMLTSESLNQDVMDIKTHLKSITSWFKLSDVNIYTLEASIWTSLLILFVCDLTLSMAVLYAIRYSQVNSLAFLALYDLAFLQTLIKVSCRAS